MLPEKFKPILDIEGLRRGYELVYNKYLKKSQLHSNPFNGKNIK